MKDIKSLQLDVENYCLNRNGKTPDSWEIRKDNDKLFYIEKSSGKKRYGIATECEYCNRIFLARNSFKNVVVCSNFCGNAKKKKEIKVSCAWCEKEIVKNPSKLNNSKHGLHFCNRKCKENAQSIGGIEQIQPNHYKDGSASYSTRAFRHYGCKCVDCDITMKTFLEVHHIDGNRKNGKLENLEVVCYIHHMLRHMMKNEKNNWIVDFHFLTPRDKLEELRNVLIGN